MRYAYPVAVSCFLLKELRCDTHTIIKGRHRDIRGGFYPFSVFRTMSMEWHPLDKEEKRKRKEENLFCVWYGIPYYNCVYRCVNVFSRTRAFISPTSIPIPQLPRMSSTPENPAFLRTASSTSLLDEETSCIRNRLWTGALSLARLFSRPVGQGCLVGILISVALLIYF